MEFKDSYTDRMTFSLQADFAKLIERILEAKDLAGFSKNNDQDAYDTYERIAQACAGHMNEIMRLRDRMEARAKAGQGCLTHAPLPF